MKQKKLNKLFDEWVTILGAVVSLAIIPQVLKIWAEQDASGVSLVTWILFTIWSITMLIYGIAHKLKPVVISYAVGSYLNLLVVVGVILY